MSLERRYTKQFPFVGTETQQRKIEERAAATRRSRAAVIRECIDREFGLDDGEEPAAKAE